MKRALVTGAAGFVGQWLCRDLLRGGWAVTGTRLEDELPVGALTPAERRAVQWAACDVTDAGQVRSVVGAARADAVFHLAGVSFVPDAGGDPGGALEVNVVGTARLLAELARLRHAGVTDPVVLVIGSGEQYGRHPAGEQPLPESAAQWPLNAYAASKAAQEVVALEVVRSAGLRVVLTRSFNHSGPGQPARFLLPALAERAVALRRQGGVVHVGNLGAVRDFLHVADVVQAYVALVAHGESGEAYNVASGLGIDVETLARRVLALAGVDAKLQVDPALTRPVEVPVLVGDSSKLRAATGWRPEHSLDSLILDLIRAAAR